MDWILYSKVLTLLLMIWLKNYFYSPEQLHKICKSCFLFFTYNLLMIYLCFTYVLLIIDSWWHIFFWFTDIFQVYVRIFQTYRPSGRIYGIFQEHVGISNFYGFQMAVATVTDSDRLGLTRISVTDSDWFGSPWLAVTQVDSDSFLLLTKHSMNGSP